MVLFEGRVVKTLTCEKLPVLENINSQYKDLAVHGDALMTTDGSNMIHVFQMSW